MTKYQNINENIYNFELRIGEACSLELGDGSFYSIQLLSSQNLKEFKTRYLQGLYLGGWVLLCLSSL